MGDDTLSVTYDVRRKARGAEPEERPHRWKHRLIAVGVAALAAVIAITALLIYWANTYVSTIRAEVRARMVVLSPDFDARLAELYVEEGQHVKQGKEIARFDDSGHKAQLAAAEAGVVLKQSQYEAAQTGVASSEAALEFARVRVKGEIRRAEANKKTAEARLAHLRSGARDEEIEVAEARLDSARALASLYESQLEQSRNLVKRNIESKFDLKIAETKLTTQENVVKEAQLEVDRLKAGPREEVIEEAVQVVKAREAELALARAAENGLKRLRLELEDRKARLRQAGAELERAQMDVRSRQVALENMVLRSPVAGTVVRIYFYEGEVVRKGEVTIQVADDASGRWVEGFVREEDAEHVEPGQPVEVEIGIDSGSEDVEAVVEQVGYAKARATGSRRRSFSEADDYGRPAPIWVRIGFKDTNARPRPGTSASAVIRVR